MCFIGLVGIENELLAIIFKVESFHLKIRFPVSLEKLEL